MSQRTGSCPNCGAPLEFRWSSSVQTVCDYCKSIIVRTDIDIQKVGMVADLPPNSSPLQIGAEGKYGNKAFVIAGRIIYEYDQGNWNEWHLIFNDGVSGWLSDAQLNYDVSFLDTQQRDLPSANGLEVGRIIGIDNLQYHVTTITRARYRGVEGELPFQYWDKAEVPFVDLRTTTGRFATIDYSEQPALLFTGEAVEFEALKLKNVREFEGWSR
jgi:hypothetical protein